MNQERIERSRVARTVGPESILPSVAHDERGQWMTDVAFAMGIEIRNETLPVKQQDRSPSRDASDSSLCSSAVSSMETLVDGNNDQEMRKKLPEKDDEPRFGLNDRVYAHFHWPDYWDTADIGIVATAIPTLARRWSSLDDIGWYGAAYLLPQPTLQPSIGKLYPYFNTKYGLLFGLFVFEAGSLFCALSNSSMMFIASRTMAGVGAAILAPGMLLMLTDSISKQRRPLFTGIAASAAGAAACLGPVLGGVFTTKLSWRWCFYINIPLGFAGGILIGALYHPLRRHQEAAHWKEIFLRLDPVGCLLLTSSVVSLLLAFSFAAESAWNNARVIALLTLFAVLLIVLVAQQMFVDPEYALLPRTVLKKKGILQCAIFGFLIEVGSTGHIFYLPFYFQGAKGVSAEDSGVDVLPYLLSQTIAGLVTGVFIFIAGSFNPPMILGTELFTVGAGLLLTLSPTTPGKQWIGYQVLAGFGTGCSQFMAMGIAQQLLARNEESIGLSLVYMIKTLGSATSVSLCSTIFQTHLRGQLLSAKLPPAQVSSVIASISGLGDGVSDQLKATVAKAVGSSTDAVFLFPFATGITAFLLALVTEPVRIQKAPPTSEQV